MSLDTRIEGEVCRVLSLSFEGTIHIYFVDMEALGYVAEVSLTQE